MAKEKREPTKSDCRLRTRKAAAWMYQKVTTVLPSALDVLKGADILFDLFDENQEFLFLVLRLASITLGLGKFLLLWWKDRQNNEQKKEEPPKEKPSQENS